MGSGLSSEQRARRAAALLAWRSHLKNYYEQQGTFNEIKADRMALYNSLSWHTGELFLLGSINDWRDYYILSMP